MATEQLAQQAPGVINLMRLRGEAGDYYLYCEDWPGRIFIELSSGAFLIADGPDGQPILQPVEPYRPKRKTAPPAPKTWWRRLFD